MRSVQAVLSDKRHALLEGGIDIQQQLRDEIPPDLLEKHSTLMCADLAKTGFGHYFWKWKRKSPLLWGRAPRPAVS
jgi:hypothetical protein